MSSPNDSRVAVLFSGGTDSTASAALLAGRFAEVHLLTYTRLGFHHSSNSDSNHQRLAARFPETRLIHHIFETTPLARHITEQHRGYYIKKYGMFTLQNCGFCALVNHVGTLAYCLRNGIGHSADGITYDWPFFPGHMDKVIAKFREMYRGFDIEYHTPVIHFDVAEEPQYVDKITGASKPQPGRTTGKLLRELGLAESDNYKGSELDRRVQARCYQFVLPNLFIHWVFRAKEHWDDYERIVVEYFSELMQDCDALLRQWHEHGQHRELFAFLDEPA